MSSSIRFSSLALFLRDIKISHSLFALPFAASVFSLGIVRLPSAWQVLLLVLAMIFARSFAMGMNRYLDRHVDGENPRTLNRLIPAAKMQASEGRLWSILAGLAFMTVSFLLNPLAGFLSLPLLLILMSYSKMKHLSWLTHWYLGFCLGLAPIAVGVALEGTFFRESILLGACVMFWTAGFDILYAMQDKDFDRSKGLESVPARFGIRHSLWISGFSFAAMMLGLTALGLWLSKPGLYYLGLGMIAMMLAYEIWLVSDSTEMQVSKNMNAAFFNVNASISLVYFAITVCLVSIYG